MSRAVSQLSVLHRSEEAPSAETLIRTLRHYIDTGCGLGHGLVVELTKRARLTGENFVELSRDIEAAIERKKFQKGVDRGQYASLRTYFTTEGARMLASGQKA